MRDATISRERKSFVDDSAGETGKRSIIGLTAGGTYDDVLIDVQRRIVLSPSSVIGGTIIANIQGDYIDNSAFTVNTDRGLAIGGIATGGTISSGDFGVLKINTDRELITYTSGGTLNDVTITSMPSVNISGGTIDSIGGTVNVNISSVNITGGTLDYIASVGGSINSRPMSTTPMYNEVNNVVGGAETTLLSYIVGGTPLYIHNIISTGTASAEYFLYLNSIKVLTSRTSTADRTSNLIFPGPMAATVGTLLIRVLHGELAQQDFQTSMIYNT